jgi:hypothetical protein
LKKKKSVAKRLIYVTQNKHPIYTECLSINLPYVRRIFRMLIDIDIKTHLYSDMGVFGYINAT